MAKFIEKNPKIAEIYNCAKAIWDQCLVEDNSLVFDDNVWTLKNLEILHERFILNPDESKDSFLTKFHGQIGNESPAITRLAGEILVIYYLFPVHFTVRGDTKRANINTVFGWNGDSLQQDDLAFRALEYGIGGTGQGYLSYQYLEIAFLINAAIKFKKLSKDARQSLNEPWKFQDFLDSTPGAEKRQGRHTLLHLMFPDFFERIAKGDDKKLIVAAFHDKITDDTPNIDRQLLSIRHSLEEGKAGKPIDFYSSSLKPIWKPQEEDSGDKLSLEDDFRAWFAIQKKADGELYKQGARDQYIYALKVATAKLDDIQIETTNLFHYTTLQSFSDVYDIISEAPNFKTVKSKFGGGAYSAGLKLYKKFLSEREGDHISADPASAPGAAIDSPAPTLDKPYTLQTIVDEGCFLPYDELAGMLERLRYKKNIILQGPPGTGKTWLGKKLAYALLGGIDTARFRSVQFHSTISYEDFVRGWRPVGEGKLGLCDGPFLNLIHEAKGHPDKPYVMLIEEINRGNPAQIFGELLTLLEADKRHSGEALQLCYQKDGEAEAVHIPPNIYVIGTMNIADRSLALVDFALRRRFSFITLVPTFGDKWREWMVRNDKAALKPSFVDVVAQKMSQLNESISNDPTLGWQYAVGHSYVTSDQPISEPEKWFLSIVTTELEPLLREYWFDAPDRVDEEISKLKSGISI